MRRRASAPAATSSPVAVIRAVAGPGEMLCVVPALRSLRLGRPHARVTVVGLESGRWLAERRPDLVDHWIDVPAWPGVHDTVGDHARTVAWLASSRPPYELVVQLHGPGGPVNRLAQVLSAGTTAVHVEEHAVIAERRAGVQRSWPRLIERAWPREGHEARRLLGLMTAIGSPPVDIAFEIPERPRDLDDAVAVWRRLRGRPFVVVHPSARRVAQAWPPEAFAEVARNLAVDGWVVVVTGSGSSREAVARVALRAGVRVVPALDLPLAGLLAVMRRASAVVTSDVDAAQLAQSTGCPVNIVASAVDLERWGLLSARHGRVRVPSGDARSDVAQVLADVRGTVRRAPTSLYRPDRPFGRLASPT